MAKVQRQFEAKPQIDPTRALNQQQTVAYIMDVALGLRGLAKQTDLSFLTYLLDMVVHEAMQQSELPRRRRSDKE